VRTKARRHPIGVALGALLLLACGLPAMAVDEALLLLARQRRADFLEDLAAAVAIDSGSEHRPGLTRMADWLAGQLRGLGAEVETLPATPSAGTNVVGRLQGSGRGRVLMMIHMDTVYPPGEAARRPFRLDGERAYGPGVADAKGGIVMILQALGIARERGWRDFERITVLFNADEEISSVGSRALIRRLAGEHDVVLSFEPPDHADEVITSTKGIAYLELTVTGKASHAGAAPEDGRNAAVELAAQVLQMRGLGRPELGTTVNWTVLDAGDRKNMIPDLARATADMRLTDPAELARVRRQAAELVKRRFVAGTTAEIALQEQRPPLPPNPATRALAATATDIYAEIGRSLRTIAMGFGTDAGFAHDPAGDGPAVLEGLGIAGGRLHSPDEWADVASIPARLYLTVRLLEEAGGTR
jgi:glutamate carboxypeptidase